MMLLTSKPSCILYLKRQGAVLVAKDTSARLDIAPEFINNLEVGDPAKLAELIAGFLESYKVHNQQVLLVLDSSVVFQKTVAATDHEAPKNFESMLPFEPESRQLITIEHKGQLSLYGVNKGLYQAIAKGIQKANKLKAVVPAAAYTVQEDKIDRSAIHTFLTDSTPIKHANFLNKV